MRIRADPDPDPKPWHFRKLKGMEKYSAKSKTIARERLQSTNQALTSLTNRMTERARSFITDSVQSDQPFFLYFSFNHVHFPQFAGPKFRNSSHAGTYGDSVAEMDGAVGDILDTLRQSGWDTLTRNTEGWAH